MNGSDLLFDTNAVIAWIDDAASISASLNPSGRLLLPLFALAELRYGAKKSARSRANLERLDRALKDFEILNPDQASADFYADVRNNLRAKGHPIPENDVWIATLAIQHGLPLVTRDAHFRVVDGLTIVSW
jgi:tRNA(fMet)-specific endonuclease VapC